MFITYMKTTITPDVSDFVRQNAKKNSLLLFCIFNSYNNTEERILYTEIYDRFFFCVLSKNR
jgi:hypothetical protein